MNNTQHNHQGEIRMTLQDFILSHYEEGSTREQARPMVEAFYYYLNKYPEYVASLTSNANTDPRPNYTYAERMSGMSSRFIRQCESEYTGNAGKDRNACQ
jgi:hypothetical protein